MKKLLAVTLMILYILTMSVSAYYFSAEECVARIENYYNNGMYYEARDELIWLEASNNRNVWDKQKIDAMKSKINYHIDVMDYVYAKFKLIKSYLNQGLYYEAKDELNWLKQGYTLGPAEQKIWGEYELDAGLGTYKLEHRNEAQREKLKEYMWRHFENTSLRMQADIWTDITKDWMFVNAKQDIKGYDFEDVDNDGNDELIITSKPITSEYYGNCFSIWDCRENGDVYCVLAKCGQYSRSAYRYFIVRYYGENYLLETTGMDNSAGTESERYLYRIKNGVIYPDKRMMCSTFDENKNYIDGVRVSMGYAKSCVDTFDNTFVRLVSQEVY